MNRIADIVKILKSYDGPAVRLMEVCGTHTDSIFKNGIRDMISPEIKLISGPGCPVCVTPEAFIDRACELATDPGCKVYAFGDMLKVKGSVQSLTMAKAAGARVEMIYSPLEVYERAMAEPDTLHVVAAVGFETTVPAYALLLERCIESGVRNVRLLTSLKRIIPALDHICSLESPVDGFLCPGHVSVIIGEADYAELALRYRKPLAIAGFTGEHILAAVYDLLQQLQTGRAQLHNLYRNAVNREGNPRAKELIRRYFEPGAACWRGLGILEASGLYLRPDYTGYGIALQEPDTAADSRCLCGGVMTGQLTPPECGLFGRACRPDSPAGPCMVSAEGACGIWYKYQSDRF